MYVFGGQGKGSKVFKDMHALDLKTWTWMHVRCATAPPPARAGHSALLMGDKIVVCGGWDLKRTFGDLWVFDTKAFSWLRPRTAGRPPTGRYGHSCELTDDGRLLIFGGYSVKLEEGRIAPRTEFLSDVRELDTTTMEWTRPRVIGDMPAARHSHRTCMMGLQMLSIGGWTGVPRCVLCNVEKKGGGGHDEHDIDCIVGKSLYAAPAGAGGDMAGAPRRVDFVSCLDTGSMEWFQPSFRGEPPANMQYVLGVGERARGGGEGGRGREGEGGG